MCIILNISNYIPEGMKDYLYEDCYTKICVENKIENLFIRSGYDAVISPMLEYYDVFYKKKKSLQEENMYKLFDRSGKIMVLRPDMTIPIARIAACKLDESRFPAKLCYKSNIFRLNDSYDGKLSEITQCGIEIIGTKSIKSDADAAIQAIKALKCAGLDDFVIEIGQAEFFKNLISETKLDKYKAEFLRKAVEDKNYSLLNEMLNSYSSLIPKEVYKILLELPKLFGGTEIFDYVKEIYKGAENSEALINLKDVYRLIKSAGFGRYISIDLGMVQHNDYYTGVILRGYSKYSGDNLIVGGRYDNLISEFGKNIPATGMAVNINYLTEALRKQGLYMKNTIDFLVYGGYKMAESCYKIIDKIQSCNMKAEMSLSDDKESALKYAESKKIKNVICIDDDSTINFMEYKNGQWFAKKMGMGEFYEYCDNSTDKRKN